MAPSSTPSSRSASRPSSLHPPTISHNDSDSISVETLVELLLHAKRALSSMNLVLRGNELSTRARKLQEETVILSAQTVFLRSGINQQVRILLNVRNGLRRAYDAGKKDFDRVIRMLDGANDKLEQTMGMLRLTMVESVFRPEGEEPRNLLDFVDENSVDRLLNALKEGVEELQAAQSSLENDINRFEDDLQSIKNTMTSAASPSPSRSGSTHEPVPALIASLFHRSHEMASILTMLTTHFDLCVTAVRTTEGGSALARRKAAETTHDNQDGEAVSISGVINDADATDLEPISAEDRAEMLRVVLQDAEQVDGAVADMTAELHEMEEEFAAVKIHADSARARYTSMYGGFRVLEDVGSRLADYAAAEAEFAGRWRAEKDEIAERLDEMENLRVFYDGYASAYDTLILEVERRRSVEDKIQSVWRKARDSVDKLVEADARERQIFRQEIGDYLPTDLWVGMGGPVRRWDVVPVSDPETRGQAKSASPPEKGTRPPPALDRSVVEAARQRLSKAHSGR